MIPSKVRGGIPYSIGRREGEQDGEETSEDVVYIDGSWELERTGAAVSQACLQVARMTVVRWLA
jgi:hypothetical protein